MVGVFNFFFSNKIFFYYITRLYISSLVAMINFIISHGPNLLTNHIRSCGFVSKAPYISPHTIMQKLSALFESSAASFKSILGVIFISQGSTSFSCSI